MNPSGRIAVTLALFSAISLAVLPAAGDPGRQLGGAEAGEVRVFQGHQGEVWSVAFSADGRRALSGGGSYRSGSPVDCVVRLWDVASGKELRVYRGHTRPVVCVTFAPDGRVLLSSSIDTTAQLWDVETG